MFAIPDKYAVAIIQPKCFVFVVQVGAEYHGQWFQDPSRSISDYRSYGTTAMAVVLQVSYQLQV